MHCSSFFNRRLRGYQHSLAPDSADFITPITQLDHLPQGKQKTVCVAVRGRAETTCESEDVLRRWVLLTKSKIRFLVSATKRVVERRRIMRSLFGGPR